jgi:hypothetical protein
MYFLKFNDLIRIENDFRIKKNELMANQKTKQQLCFHLD